MGNHPSLPSLCKVDVNRGTLRDSGMNQVSINETRIHVCPFEYTAFAVSGKVGIPKTGLTTPVGLLSLFQLAVLNRSTIVV